jgi:hypothetical protein
MIKSALMTSAGDVLDGPNTHPLVIFRQGAGHVRPNDALNPGLVFNSGFADWLGFLCGTQLPTSFCTSAGVPVLDPSDLNLASIAIGDLAGAQTVKRRVTNVGDPAKYTMSVSGLAGITVTVSPAEFTLKTGQSQDLKITFTNNSAAVNAYVGGQLTWNGSNGERVRVPAVIRPVALGAPTAVAGTGGPIAYDVTFGYDGPFTASLRGLVAPTITESTVADDPTNGPCSLSSPGAVLVPVVIPAGTTYARYALFDADVSAGADIDLCVFQGTSLVGSSGSGTSAEEVNFAFGGPTDGPIPRTVVVQGWGVNGTSPFKLHEWYVPAVATGNMAIAAPTAATMGAKGTITLTPAADLAAGRWLGSVSYSGASGMPSPTIVSVTKQ